MNECAGGECRKCTHVCVRAHMCAVFVGGLSVSWGSSDVLEEERALAETHEEVLTTKELYQRVAARFEHELQLTALHRAKQEAVAKYGFRAVKMWEREEQRLRDAGVIREEDGLGGLGTGAADEEQQHQQWQPTEEGKRGQRRCEEGEAVQALDMWDEFERENQRDLARTKRKTIITLNVISMFLARAARAR